MICFIFLSIKVFVARYDYQAQKPGDLSFRKGKAVNIVLYNELLTGEVFKVINNEGNDCWLMYSFDTDNAGYVPVNYTGPIERNLSLM